MQDRSCKRKARHESSRHSESAGHSESSVLVVLLRQPRMNVPTEMRSDPFWEFGSFGLTGCHQRNLLHPKNASLLNGSRLAFVQGGKQGFRLVYLTEPVHADAYSDRTEVLWKPGSMPFRYSDAPIVLDSDGRSDIAGMAEFVSSVKRNGWMGKFASKFRSRCQPLPEPIAEGFMAAFEARRREGPGLRALTYLEALPVVPPLVDRNRRQTYRQLKEKARAS